jgi:hypothetical protein
MAGTRWRFVVVFVRFRKVDVQERVTMSIFPETSLVPYINVTDHRSSLIQQRSPVRPAVSVFVAHFFCVLRMFLWLFESVIQIIFTSSFLATSEVAQVSSPATVGPQATLYAINEFIAPDGFRRSYVLSLLITVFSVHLIFFPSAHL